MEKSWVRERLAVALTALLAVNTAVPANRKAPALPQTLTLPAASSFARVALRCVEKQYPNKLDHVINDAHDLRSPQELHPSFYGCFDWHSAVHGHWMLARLLRLYPELPEAQQIRRVFASNLRPETIALEVSYLDQPNRKSFERTYGWAWLLKLSAELHASTDPTLVACAEHLEPLAQAIVARYREFLPRQKYPIRTGVHPNTAFGIALALDYAREVRLGDFEGLLKAHALAYFARDEEYPAQWEPGGEDFLSPALMEAELLRRVLSPREFSKWFSRFLPGTASGQYPSLLGPAVVTDRTDPKLVHLDGLNLSRAWCMKGVAGALPSYGRARKALLTAVDHHLRATLPYIASGNYEGEHWLASFAVLAITESAQP